MIHPTAIIHPRAQIGAGVRIGPFAVIEEHVTVGPECEIGPYVHLTGHTTIGGGNRFHAGCVIGDAPQDLKYGGEPTRVVIGERNVFREQVTVNRSNKAAEETSIGSDCYLMGNSHVGHNVHLGDGIILANGALLGGHVVVQDRAFISGNCLVHQFVRIGTLALMQGGSAVSKDLPPYSIARGHNRICGLNTVGLRRAGLRSEQRMQLKRLYHLLFRSGLRMTTALETARAEFVSEEARVMIEFVAASSRGVCAERPALGSQTAED